MQPLPPPWNPPAWMKHGELAQHFEHRKHAVPHAFNGSATNEADFAYLTNAMHYTLGLVAVLAALAATVQFRGAIKGDTSTSDGGSFRRFQVAFLVVWFLCCMADWAQGAAIFGLIYGYSGMSSYKEMIFCVAYFSGMVSSPIVGALGDKFGRKSVCLSYCVLYSIGYGLLHVFNDWSLTVKLGAIFVSRFMTGIGNDMLYSGFESWYCKEHFKKGFSGDQLGQTMTFMWTGYYLCGIVQAIWTAVVYRLRGWDQGNTQFLVQDRYYVFHISYDLAVLFCIASFFIIKFFWTEGEEQQDDEESSAFLEKTAEKPEKPQENDEKAGVFERIGASVKYCYQDSMVLTCALVCVFFETSMFMFIQVFWDAPAFLAVNTADIRGTGWVDGLILQLSDVNRHREVLFAIALCGAAIGGYYNSTQGFSAYSSKMQLLTLSCAVILFAACALRAFVPQLESQFAFAFGRCVVCIVAIVAYEFTLSCYFATMAGKKSKVVQEAQRSTVYNLWRIPLQFMLICFCLFMSWFGNRVKSQNTFWPFIRGNDDMHKSTVAFFILVCFHTFVYFQMCKLERLLEERENKEKNKEDFPKALEPEPEKTALA